MHGNSKQLVLGVDGGATKTEWALCEQSDGGLQPVKTGRLGPGSVKLLSRDELVHLLSSIPAEPVTHAGVFLAGCATAKDRECLREICAGIWPDAALRVGSDRESAMAAALGDGDGIVVISGTGSAVSGRKDGREEHVGGWGQILGDTGGGYDLAIRALRLAAAEFDSTGTVTPFASDVLRSLVLNQMSELADWVQAADKGAISRLAALVFRHSNSPGIAGVLQAGAAGLAEQAIALTRRLKFAMPRTRLIGGIFQSHPDYVAMFSKAFRSKVSRADVALCDTPSVIGSAMLAAQEMRTAEVPVEEEAPEETALLRCATTELPNAHSENLESLDTMEIVDLFLLDERYVERALWHKRAELAAGAEAIAGALVSGGRLFYVGAGTSGRLGVLDASEIPPTFGIEPERVQGIIAGGFSALHRSSEMEEDNYAGGELVMADRGVTAADVVCGIAASGRTPFVLGALAKARSIGARTVFLTCNPSRDKTSPVADVEIDLPTGPEIISGSTRLKAATATKIVLNLFSTHAMVRLGRVIGNAMADMRPTNVKLRDRAVRIVMQRLDIDENEARTRLEVSKWNIRQAISAQEAPSREEVRPASDSSVAS